MPLIADRGDPDGLVLIDMAARPLARLRWRDEQGEQVASQFRPLPGAGPDRVAAHAVRDLAGRQITTADEGAARALVGAGSTMVRAATNMRSRLDEVAAPAPPAEGWVLGPHGWDDDLAAAIRSAYGPEHPDGNWQTDRMTRLRGLIEGDRRLPLLAGASARLRGLDGRSAGHIVTVGPVPWSDDRCGWVLDVAVAAAAQGGGLGAALLGYALRGARDAGMVGLGLTVTDGNPARHLYDRLGFRPYTRTFILRVPSS
jgi:GNAT superfamily N-acetyltransferase